MKKTVILSLFITVYTMHGQAQSIYHNSLGNSVSPSFAIVKTSDDNVAIGSGVVLSLNSNVDFGLSYNWYNDKTENIYDGKGIAGYINFLLINELKEQPFGIEFAFLYNHADYVGRSGSFKNRAFGMGLNISKQIIGETGVYSIPQIGFIFFPFSQYAYDSNSLNRSTVINQSKLVSLVWGIASENRLYNLIAEPTLGYEIVSKTFSVGLAVVFQIKYKRKKS